MLTSKSYVIYLVGCAVVFCLASCSVKRQIARQANAAMFSNPGFSPAHVGISIYDPETSRYLYNHNGEKLFVPASNIKLFTLYAGLKYLGDSIIGARYTIDDDVLMIEATGDPTFLHPDFKHQRLFQFMKQPRFKRVELHTPFATKPLGRGWAWDDFNEDYMVERDPFPMFGNLATFTFRNDTLTSVPARLPVIGKPVKGEPWQITRNLGGHFFMVQQGTELADQTTIPLAMESGAFATRYLADTLKKEVAEMEQPLAKATANVFYSQAKDSMFALMMQRSDNFLAEQTLLMVSNEVFGTMNETRLIDTLLNTDLKDLPQMPKWVDGSGLSRYNLFSPQDFVWLLDRMRRDYDFKRLQTILPTGNVGTLKGLYINNAGRIWAKTGTLSNNVALSGYLQTRSNKWLLFSVLVNHHQSHPLTIRSGIETFLTEIINRY